MFTFGTTAKHAITMMDDIEQYLGLKWNLKIKPDSRSIMLCKGSNEAQMSLRNGQLLPP